MELSIALKSLLATLTTKTTAATTDGVMLANVSDGTPNGKISISNLEKYFALAKYYTGGLDNMESGVYDCYSTSETGDRPWPTRFLLLCYIFQSGKGATQIAIRLNGEAKVRCKPSSGIWDSWKSFSFDVPAFYNSYANLAALATGIMGQNISSITAQYFQGTIAQAVFDNVFIAVTRLSENYPLAVKPKDWSSYNSASAYHVDGVLLVSGDKHLVIAPSEADLRWGADADSHAASGNTATSDRDAAMATFDGKARTNTAVQVSEYSSAEVAPGYCHAFTTVTSAYDTTKPAYARRKAGMWWLPSLGEMMMIWSNMTKINQVMSLIGGTPLSETAYWTSTEISQVAAWYLYLSNGNVNYTNMKITRRVRPVAAF